MDSTDVLNKLRQKHAQDGEDGKWVGVNVLGGTVENLFDHFVWEPELVRINVLTAATEAACTILSVDRTIKNPASEQQQAQAAGRLDTGGQAGMGRGGGRGRGRGMGRGMKVMQGRGGK
jgi:T-complex protein 1 subunit eta